MFNLPTNISAPGHMVATWDEIYMALNPLEKKGFDFIASFSPFNKKDTEITEVVQKVLNKTMPTSRQCGIDILLALAGKAAAAYTTLMSEMEAMQNAASGQGGESITVRVTPTQLAALDQQNRAYYQHLLEEEKAATRV